ncbi:hypothetical protein LTR93_011774 [Exophiala xenobiotica]|nr:hypothetical protein LTR93_011774 [Exophiala xenobiotica]
MGNSNTFDVFIIGAGISGLDTAYRVQTELPGSKYVILEARPSIGGTWDMFRYSGIRSDTDLFTFGFPWHPLTEDKVIADGELILNYLKAASDAEGISRHIRFRHKVLAADWSKDKEIWTLKVNSDCQTIQMYANALVVACGYYDYENPLQATIPSLESFKGTVVHPQFWPQSLDYADKKVVIIGSGATAITLLPNLAKKSAHVTMLQQSPTYIVIIHNNTESSLTRRLLPQSWAFRLLVATTVLGFRATTPVFPTHAHRRLDILSPFPRPARRGIRKEPYSDLGRITTWTRTSNPLRTHGIKESALLPMRDFFEAIRSGKSSVSTGHIKTMISNSIQLESGEELPAGIIVTATCLKLELAGGSEYLWMVKIGEKFLWRNSWMQDVPNFAFVLGYANASWYLGADTTAILFCRVLKSLHQRKLTTAVPRQRRKDAKALPYFNLKSTYIQRGIKGFPVTGKTGPWAGRTNYFFDLFKAKYGDLDEGMDYYRNGVLVKQAD